MPTAFKAPEPMPQPEVPTAFKAPEPMPQPEMPPSNNQPTAPPMPTAFKAPEPTMPVPAPTPPVMTGGNYYEDSIKENFQIGNARTNRNKSKKRKVRRGTSLSKKGRKGVKVL